MDKKGWKKIRLLGREVFVNAKIESIEGFSAHADKVGLLKWIKGFSPKPKKVFITHGDLNQQEALVKTLAKEKIEGYIPSLNETISL